MVDSVLDGLVDKGPEPRDEGGTEIVQASDGSKIRRTRKPRRTRAVRVQAAEATPASTVSLTCHSCGIRFTLESTGDTVDYSKIVCPKYSCGAIGMSGPSGGQQP
jgi:hypothetical protein